MNNFVATIVTASVLFTTGVSSKPLLNVRLRNGVDIFNPSSTLVSYHDKESCGPRGNDASADLSQCAHGASVKKKVPWDNWKTVAEVNGCEYFSYLVYECNGVFDPSSTLVSYHDYESFYYPDSCGPRGDDAKADLSQCAHGASVKEKVPWDNWRVVAEIRGCEYFSYTVYECIGTFDPSSTLVSYLDKESCGPRGDDAKADLSQCAHGAIVLEEQLIDGWKVVAEINGCEYFAYTVYKCDVSKLNQIAIEE